MPAQQETTLPNVLSDRLLEVPDYQRPYAWSTKQLDDLWEDLDLAGPKGQHYFGTVVLREIRDADGVVRTSIDAAGNTLRHCEVVDGQQRLTTCMLLVDRIRRRLNRLSEEGADQIAQNLRRTYGVVEVDNVSVPRLRLGTDANGYWVHNLLGDEPFVGSGLPQGVDRLRQAAAHYDSRLDELCAAAASEQVLARLRELQRRITAGLRLLVYEVASAAEVGVIFETLNERGRPLSELEKTKNYLLYLARQIPDARSDDLADFINQRWSKVFASLARPNAGITDDQLLRVHWLTTQDPDRRSWRGVASIKTAFDRSQFVSASARIVPPKTAAPDGDPFDKLNDEVRRFVQTLHFCAEYLSEMFDPHAEFSEFNDDGDLVRQSSAALQRSGVVAPYRPLLCAARLRQPKDGEFYAALVKLLECYSARVFVISQRRANAGSAKLNRLAFDLQSGQIERDEVLAGVRVLIWRYAPDESLRSSLENENENWYSRRGHKYFLYEYELHLMGGGQQIPKFSDFISTGNEQRTTEHILPQEPARDAACWWDNFTPENHVALRHSLGNLVLTLDNSSYGRKCFDLKRGAAPAPGATPTPCYAQSSLHQERELALYPVSTPEAIQTRQKALTDWAMDRWSIAAPSTTILEPEEAEPEIEADGDENDE